MGHCFVCDNPGKYLLIYIAKKSLSTIWGLFWDDHKEKGILHLLVEMGKISTLAE